MAQLRPVFTQESVVRSKAIQPHLINLDFEEGTTGQVPVGWASPTTPTYAAELTKNDRNPAALRFAPQRSDHG
jgi:hypothetical protein